MFDNPTQKLIKAAKSQWVTMIIDLRIEADSFLSAFSQAPVV
jgi:hypothetical protein